jgi:hypothetical protein
LWPVLASSDVIGKGFSLKIKRRPNEIMLKMPKKTKQPNQPNPGSIKLLAIIPTFAPIALAK